MAFILAGGLIVPCATIAAGARSIAPNIEARLWLGYDSNLLDLSDLERRAFETRDSSKYFVVDRMFDQFVEGELGVDWEALRQLAGRPEFQLGWERRQYFHNPIRSEDRFGARLRVRPARGTRLEFEAALRPQVYQRHRFHVDALPGEPWFRPEVYRRWDIDGRVRQAVGSQTSLEAIVEGSTRDYRAPFEERDRKSFGGGGGLTQSLGKHVTLRGGVRYRATWTRNEPWDPDDRSHRQWRAISGLTLGGVPFLETIGLDLELEWRRFSSTNPDDQDHFGRRDRRGEVGIDWVRAVTPKLDWVSRANWRWGDSNFPAEVVDEEGVFEEAVVRTGVVWTSRP